MASFNRAAARAAVQNTGKGFSDGRGGDYWYISKQDGGRFVLRIMPPHPTRNPEGVVLRPLHFIEKERYACNACVPDYLLGQYGNRCVWCECVEFYATMRDNNQLEFEDTIKSPALREILQNMRPKANTHVYALLIQEGSMVHTLPKPVHFIAAAKCVTEILDDNGLGLGQAQMDELTDPLRGRNFIIVKKSQKQYDLVTWDTFATPMVPNVISPDLWRELVTAKYPDIAKTDEKNYKTVAEQESILKAMGLWE